MGDQLVIFSGGNFPYKLREEVDGFYRLVGETYIRGSFTEGSCRATKETEFILM